MSGISLWAVALLAGGIGATAAGFPLVSGWIDGPRLSSKKQIIKLLSQIKQVNKHKSKKIKQIGLAGEMASRPPQEPAFVDLYCDLAQQFDYVCSFL